MHRPYSLTGSLEQAKHLLLGEVGAVYRVRINGILEVASLVVWQQNIDCFRAGFAAVGSKFRSRFRRNAVVNRVDNVVRGCEQAVSFDFLQGLRDGFLAEWAADFLEREQFRGCLILDEVNVGEAALCTVVDRLVLRRRLHPNWSPS